MENYQEKIQSVIEEALTAKTFSLEIIEKIKSIKDHDAFLEKELETTKIRSDEQSKRIGSLSADKDLLQMKVNDFEKRESDLRTKEAEQNKLRYELQFQKQRADEIRSLFEIVFRNPIWQENTSRNIPMMVNGYPSSQSESEYKTKTIS
jgi:chromosome segregation ATPase